MTTKDENLSMLRAIKRRIWVILVSVGLGVAAFAIEAHATIPDGSGVIHGCYRNVGGRLRVVDDPTTCRSGETALSWNQTGPQGPAGPQGPQGPSGSSHVYEARNIHVLPMDAYLVGLTLPPGRYAVSAIVDFFNNNDGDSNTQCALWSGSEANPLQHFHSSPGSDTAIFSGDERDDQYFATLMTTLVLTASENQILVFCSVGLSGITATAYGQIIAMAVDAIN